jgi:hypothetical protein
MKYPQTFRNWRENTRLDWLCCISHHVIQCSQHGFDFTPFDTAISGAIVDSNDSRPIVTKARFTNFCSLSKWEWDRLPHKLHCPARGNSGNLRMLNALRFCQRILSKWRPQACYDGGLSEHGIQTLMCFQKRSSKSESNDRWLEKGR